MQTEHGGRPSPAVEAGEPPFGASCMVRHRVAVPLIVVASSPSSPSRGYKLLLLPGLGAVGYFNGCE